MYRYIYIYIYTYTYIHIPRCLTCKTWNEQLHEQLHLAHRIRFHKLVRKARDTLQIRCNMIRRQYTILYYNIIYYNNRFEYKNNIIESIRI